MYKGKRIPQRTKRISALRRNIVDLTKTITVFDYIFCNGSNSLHKRLVTGIIVEFNKQKNHIPIHDV